jgi:hypothetical protein
MYIPTLKIDDNDLQNLIRFIYTHEHLLKEFGAIKIQLDLGCKPALKKTRNNLTTVPIQEKIVKINNEESIYMVQRMDNMDQCSKQNPFIKDESSFWSLLSDLKIEGQQLNISIIANKSFFLKKICRRYFDIHRLLNESILKLDGNKATCNFFPFVRRAHEAGAIFPLSSVEDNLFSIDYHHGGGAHYYYFIPNSERKHLQTIIDQKNLSLCLNHQQLFINPSLLDKYNIRYYRTIQYPNEFVVLSSGTFSQSFVEDQCWIESILFALPSSIEPTYSTLSHPKCQCNISMLAIERSLFRDALIQKYIDLYTDIGNDNQSLTIKGLTFHVEKSSQLSFTFLDIEKKSNSLSISNINTSQSGSLNGILFFTALTSLINVKLNLQTYISLTLSEKIIVKTY